MKFWRMRPLDFYRMCYGLEEDMDRQWLHTRAIALPIINAYRAPKTPAYKEASLFPTMFDKKRTESLKPKEPTPEEIERMMRHHFKALENQNGRN